jgi:hypothetical protein
MTSPKAFVELIKRFSYKDKDYTRLTPLTNVTFFLGAGFSKSWDKSFPTGNELFSFKIEDYSDELNEFIDNIGFSNIEKFDFSTFKDMAYHVSMQKKYPSIRSRYIDLYNLEMIENTMIKLNGGFEIYKYGNHGFSIDYTLKKEEELKANAPILIVPNREQD